MIEFKEVLKNANNNYRNHVINILRLNSIDKKVSGEVEAMGKAIIEAINEELQKER